jgi:hypothetical protein
MVRKMENPQGCTDSALRVRHDSRLLVFEAEQGFDFGFVGGLGY